jgi:hypothetical protein
MHSGADPPYDLWRIPKELEVFDLVNMPIEKEDHLGDSKEKGLRTKTRNP